MQIKDRIRGYLPVVVDVETGGFNKKTDALLEICAIIIGINNKGKLYSQETMHFHIKPFVNSNIDAKSIEFNGIQVDSPLRAAISEKQALADIFNNIYQILEYTKCTKSILVGHNAFFDLGFLIAAASRCKLKIPFHKFSTIDTVSLGALICKQTVLANIIKQVDIEWDNNQAHSALYDAQKTAELFCYIFNNY